MKDKISEDMMTFMTLLDSTYQRMRSLEEKMDCILHTICKNNDDKTHEAIRKYLLSNYRNDKSG